MSPEVKDKRELNDDKPKNDKNNPPYDFDQVYPSLSDRCFGYDESDNKKKHQHSREFIKSSQAKKDSIQQIKDISVFLLSEKS